MLKIDKNPMHSKDYKWSEEEFGKTIEDILGKLKVNISNGNDTGVLITYPEHVKKAPQIVRHMFEEFVIECLIPLSTKHWVDLVGEGNSFDLACKTIDKIDILKIKKSEYESSGPDACLRAHELM